MKDKPYFYIIRHTVTNKLYAGCKYSKPDSNSFMTRSGYQTTSKVIRRIIEEEGLGAFKVERIKHFDAALDVVLYESRFLKKVNAKENDMFYNQSNGDGDWINKGGYALSDKTKSKMSKPKSEETKQKMQISLKSRDKNSWVKAIETRIKNGNNVMKPEHIEKIKEHNERYWTDEVKEKHSEMMKDYYEKNPVSDEVKKKLSESRTGEKNSMYGKTHNEQTREKMKAAWAKRKAKKNQSFDENELF